jgi:DNA-binding MarR family transcriptional regulator
MPNQDREDLAALFTRISRRLIEYEQPLLDSHRLTMWEYVVLTRLTRRAAPSQLALARAIDYDKTRLVALLDGLERRGLVARVPDAADRRAHAVRLTPAGSRLHAAAQADIRAMEADVLGALSEREQRTLLGALRTLVHRR